MPAGASEDFFILRGRNWLIIIIIINGVYLRLTPCSLNVDIERLTLYTAFRQLFSMILLETFKSPVKAGALHE